MGRKRRVIEVGGRVQGVGFRAFVNRTAEKHAIDGFVKNLSNGNVYIDAEGEEDALNHFQEACTTGPIWSKVSSFTSIEHPIANYSSFSIQY